MTHGLVWLGPCEMCGRAFSILLARALAHARAGVKLPDRCPWCAPSLHTETVGTQRICAGS